jgi:hypothetical protein
MKWTVCMMKNSDDEVDLMSIQNNEDDSSTDVNFGLYFSVYICILGHI